MCENGNKLEGPALRRWGTGIVYDYRESGKLLSVIAVEIANWAESPASALCGSGPENFSSVLALPN